MKFGAFTTALLLCISTVVGTTPELSVEVTRGIQYGVLPFRFMPATATGNVNSSTGNQFGPVCIQSGVPSQMMSEECLFLNVYRPTNVREFDPLPVMVWIHGGSFESGAGSQYDGTKMAATQQVVVVTINYRLGPLGFLATNASGFGGLAGVSDQVLALQWVADRACSKLLFDTVDFLFLATDMVAAARAAAMVAELSSWLGSSAMAAVLRLRRRLPPRSTTPALSPS